MSVPILIVDDDVAIRQMLRRVLEDAGYPVSEAADGRQALEYLRTHADPTIVLLDVNMPVMDGIAVMRHAESEPTLLTRNAFVIVTAHHGHLPPEFLQQLTRLAVPVLEKPFRLTQALEAVAGAEHRLNRVASERT